MSLVADYSDSEEEIPSNASNDGDDDDNPNSKIKSASTNDLKNGEKFGGGSCANVNTQKLEDTRVDTKSRRGSNNFLLSPLADSGSSESEDDEVPKKRTAQTQIKLDNPFRTFGASTNVSKEDSVFRNPFREKEDEKIAVLEHHVKMTDNPETSLTINGKKICWNYRKRKCYLGTQCPYAHDSDVPLTDEQLKEQKVEDDLHRAQGGGSLANLGGGLKNSFGTSHTKTHLPGTASVVAGGYDASAFYSSPHLSGSHKNSTNTSNKDVDLNVEQPYSKSKKRVGLTNSLIPPKKALNLYHKTKDT